MTAETAAIIGWIACGMGLAAILLSQIMYSWDAYWIRRHTSRFGRIRVTGRRDRQDPQQRTSTPRELR